MTRDGETTRRGRVRYGGGERQLRGDEGVSIRRPHTRGHGDGRQGRTRARGRSLGGRAGIGGDQDGGRDRRAQDRVRAGAVARWHVDAAPGNSTLAGSGSGTVSSGALSPPPSSTTHCTRYVLRMWENTCSTSPAGFTLTIWHAAGSGRVAGRAPPPGESGRGGTLRSGRRRVYGRRFSSAGVVGVGTFGEVGNSWSPARRPGISG